MNARVSAIIVGLAIGVAAPTALGGVMINEVFINPPGSLDNTQEFIELMGTPGMKLDGYAIANVNGVLTKYYPLNSIPPIPFAIAQEIDEIFSLDGLTLGANGLLVIGVGFSFDYETLLPDTSFVNWFGLWNGVNLTNPPGRLENDGSTTVMLIRNRPGQTQADPLNPAGLRWGKDILPDGEVFSPEVNPQTGIPSDRLGDGNLDTGLPDNIGGFTLDLKGKSTSQPGEEYDDLEVVDEVSYENEQGWEYDVDGRRVDVGSSTGGLRDRRVHALGDPQGFNPDVLTRVDYRTKGPGWPPAPGGTGELPNGNNWQDTASENWIRGDTVVGGIGTGGSPLIFFDISANADPNAVQPYRTHVPLWLNDGMPPDFNFTTPNFHPVAAGRTNPLARPYIPGDVDRDGDCDADDIAKLAAVFGDDDWIFSNSFSTSTYGDSNDPATQTRPWDVDGTGDNGIEASDLQWVLNFQGDTTGRIVGVRYDSMTPATTGVILNPAAGTTCTVTTAASTPCGRPTNALFIGDTIVVTVHGQVTTGANSTPGEENGIMQFVHDAVLSTGGVLRVVGVEPLGTFAKTRAVLESPQGVAGDLGMRRINGHTTSFTQGIGGTADLYRITLKAVATGSTTLTLAPANLPKFAASTPRGLKIGHTWSQGNPAAANYPAALAFTVTSRPIGDLDGDNLVTTLDAPLLAAVLTGLDTTPALVAVADINCDGQRNGLDIQAFVDILLGP